MKDKKKIHNIDTEQAYRRSVDFLKKCAHQKGFRAALLKKENYYRIWGRDGVVNGLAALMTEDKELIKTFKKNLMYLAEFQGKSGQIPSNVSLEGRKVSYGRTAGRVDPTSWFVIGCSQYYKKTDDKRFLKKMKKNLDRCMAVLDAWEFNQKDFIFVPTGGDWADESLRYGYILFDQLLYNKAIEEYINIYDALNKKLDPYWKNKKERQKGKIKINFWPDRSKIDRKSVYHKQIFDNKLTNVRNQKYWLESFYPGGFSDTFDSFANILAIIFGFSDKEQAEKIIAHIQEIIGGGYLVPSFYPIVFPKNKKEWEKMRGNFSFRFKNEPYCSQNGGLWPVLSGFLIEALVKMGKDDLAERYLQGVNYANSLGDWGFYEFHHGKDKTPQGVKNLAWSAAGGIMGYLALNNNKRIFI